MREIKCTSRVSFKQPTAQSGDIFYTYEYSESQTVELDYEKEKKELWDRVINEVNQQIIATKEMYKPKPQLNIENK